MKTIPSFHHPQLLVGTDTSDDAGVYKISKDTALIQTVDIFTPVVDDPYTFGQIVAANCLSDVWAMGGKVLTTLNLFGYPPARMNQDSAAEMLRGCGEKVKEAGAVLCGGHTWIDPEVRMGLAVSGIVHPDRIITNSQSQPGDLLVLTKPIGLGIMTFAAIQKRIEKKYIQSAVNQMTTLNLATCQAMIETGVNACTDITGFSLLGHAVEMAQASKVGFEIDTSRVPVLNGAEELAGQGITLPLGKSNADSFGKDIHFHKNITEGMRSLLFDPQTSGGLLISVSKEKCDDLINNLQKQGVEYNNIIGKVTDKNKGRILVTP